MRQFIDFFLSIRDSKFFTGLVISVIVASAIYAGASSYDIPNQYTVVLDYFDYAITVFFLVEILIRIFAEANHPLRFFKNGWNIFDFIIVFSFCFKMPWFLSWLFFCFCMFFGMSIYPIHCLGSGSQPKSLNSRSEIVRRHPKWRLVRILELCRPTDLPNVLDQLNRICLICFI